MYITDSFPETLKNWLALQLDGKGYDLMTEFPRWQNNEPIIVPTIAIGVKSSSIKQKYDEYGEKVHGVMEMIATFDISIHNPVRIGGYRLHTIFSEITDLLLFNTNLDILEIGSGKMEYVRLTDSIKMVGFVTLRADIVRNPNGGYSSPLEI